MQRIEDHTMNRKEFLQLSAGIGGMGIPGMLTNLAPAVDTESSQDAALDDSYLVKVDRITCPGLTWFSWPSPYRADPLTNTHSIPWAKPRGSCSVDVSWM